MGVRYLSITSWKTERLSIYNCIAYNSGRKRISRTVPEVVLKIRCTEKRQD